MQDQMVLPMVGTSPGTAYRTRKPLRFGTAPKSLAPVALKSECRRGLRVGMLPAHHAQATARSGSCTCSTGARMHFLRRTSNFLRQVASQVAIALENALEFSELSESKDRLAEEGLYLRDEIRTEHHFEDILGNSSGLRQVLRQVETVAPNETTVLIQGETGTGKELIARAIHDLSSRRDNIFVKLNCAAIPLGLLESELFGHERGAFTGSDQPQGRPLRNRSQGHAVSRRSRRHPARTAAQACCAFCRSRNSSVWAARARSAPMCVWWPRPIATWARWWSKGNSAPTSITA